MKVVAFAGGVGGAKLVDGIAEILSPDDFSVVVNTGDDFEILSLRVSPDLDTVCYTLAGLANPETGWGQRDETWVTFDGVTALGGPDWFRLGDRDLATHLMRTTRINQGALLSEITRDFCQRWQVTHPIYPMTDHRVRTIVHTSSGESLSFQTYFVRRGCQPVVESFEFQGAQDAQALPAALHAIRDADLIVLAPSNPLVSIDPILAVPGYLTAIAKKPVLAVSPLIGGKAIKGPAAKMYLELGIEPTASAVAQHYREFLSGFIFDTIDRAELDNIERWRIIPLVTDILMKDKQDRVRLAKEVLKFAELVLNRSR